MKKSIFGSSGFIGSHFCSSDSDLFKISRESNKPISNTDTVYFISTTHNYNVFENVNLDIDVNLTKLVSVLKEFKVKCPNNIFNFISSWFVYGDTDFPANEDSTCKPKGFYSITKYAAEQLIQSYCETFNLKYRILRLCNVYGENATNVSVKRNALQFMVRKVIANEDVELYDDGSNIRDFMHVKDVCKAITLCIDKADTNTIINVGSGIPQRFRPLIEYVKFKTGSTSKLITIAPPDFHKTVQVQDMYLDISKLKSLGFKPTISIFTGLDRIIESNNE